MNNSTLVGRVAAMGSIAYNYFIIRPKIYTPWPSEDGIVDTLRQLIFYDNFEKQGSEEHMTASMLLRAF